MASVNKVILVGNCGRDPEMRYLPDGKAACAISIATTSKRKDKQSGEVIEDTQWHRVQFFDRLAEIVGEYVRKGSPLYIEGRLKYGKYTGQDGVERNTADIVASELQLLGVRESGAPQQQAPRQQQAPQGAPRQQAPQQRQPQQMQRQQPPQQQYGGSSGFDDMGDDIPF